MNSLTQPSFAKGVLSPELRRRVDLAAYDIGAKELSNLVVLPRGGAQARTGTQYVGEVKTSADSTRLVDFVFSTTQAYVLEFGDYYMRVWKDGGQVVKTVDDTSDWATGTSYAVAAFVKSGTTIYRCTSAHTSGATTEPGTGVDWATKWAADADYEIYTPYPKASLSALKFEQSADTLYVVHPSYAPREITRTGHAAWTIAEYDFANGPLRKENDTDTTITVTVTASPTDLTCDEDEAVTLTASAATFASTMVGGVFGIRHKAYATSYTLEMSGSGNYDSVLGKVWGEWKITINPDSSSLINHFDLLFWRSIDDGATYQRFRTIAKTSDSANIEITGSEEEPAIIKVTRDGSTSAESDSCSIVLDCEGHYEWATFKVTAFTSTTVVTGTAEQDFDQCVVAFKTWAEGSWSPYRGYPSAVGFYQDRLCFGQNATEPNSFWDSKTGDYVNMGMSIPAVDDDSIQSRLPSRLVNPIHWLVPLQAQLALTGDSEWTIEPTTTGMFTASSLKMRQQSSYGCSDTVEPVIIGDLCLFVTRFGNGVRALGYDEVNGKQQSDMSVFANHLFDGVTVVDWAYQQNPNSVLWCVMSDGTLCSLTFHKEHEVIAWATHETDGTFESIACVPGTTQDEIYFIVNRTINSATKRYIEKFANRVVSDVTDYIGLDCSLTYDGAAATSITGLTHLIGETVEALADGVIRKSLTVSGAGAITLPVAASTVQVGLPFNWKFTSLQVNPSSKTMPVTSDKKKLINAVTVSLVDSYGGEVGDTQFSMIPYPTCNTVLYTGDISMPIPGGWSKNGEFTLQGTGTLPFHIINLCPVVTVGDR